MFPSSDATAEETTALEGTAFEAAEFEAPVFQATVFEATVTLPANLHARPAGKLAQAAGRFSSTIRLRHGGKSVNPAGVLAVMSLGATAGTTVTIHAEGADAELAVRTLTEVLNQAE